MHRREFFSYLMAQLAQRSYPTTASTFTQYRRVGLPVRAWS
jgi:hypothetical protein